MPSWVTVLHAISLYNGILSMVHKPWTNVKTGMIAELLQNINRMSKPGVNLSSCRLVCVRVYVCVRDTIKSRVVVGVTLMWSSTCAVTVLAAGCGEVRLRVRLRLASAPPFISMPAPPAPPSPPSPPTPNPLLFRDAVLELNAWACNVTTSQGMSDTLPLNRHRQRTAATGTVSAHRSAEGRSKQTTSIN